MGHPARSWLAALGAAAAAGAMVLAQAGTAGAAPGAAARPASAIARSAGAAYVPARMTLRLGMSGPAVRALQRRLSVLHYYPGRIDGHFGWATMEAVWAFKEVQTGKVIPPNPDIVGPAMQRQLLHPRLPKVLRPHGPGWRVEINKNIQVLVVYRRGKVILISHTSTAKYYRSDGSGWITPDGKHRALRFVRGWVCGGLGCMYNPVVFTPDGAYAIHGEPNPTATFGENGVPLNPASHGCVRIPMDVADILHTLIRIGPRHGTPIYIEGGNYYG